MDRMIELPDGAAVNARTRLESQECIFVFGLPRSGTTLVERILASHSAVRAAGELQAFPAETIQAVQRICAGPVGKQEFSRRALDVDPRALGQAYLDAARLEDGGAARFVDK